MWSKKTSSSTSKVEDSWNTISFILPLIWFENSSAVVCGDAMLLFIIIIILKFMYVFILLYLIYKEMGLLILLNVQEYIGAHGDIFSGDHLSLMSVFLLIR